MTRLLTVFFTWVAVYVVFTATLLGAGLDMPLPVQTFLLTAVLVPTMMFILGPIAAALARTGIGRFD